MKIKFSKRRLYAHFFMGLVSMALGIFHLFFNQNPIWVGIVYSFLGINYVFHSIYDFKHPYLSIENGIVKKNKLYGFKNKIELDSIEEIRRTKNGYILKSETTYLKINTSLIGNDNLIELIELFRSLNLPSEKTFLKAS